MSEINLLMEQNLTERRGKEMDEEKKESEALLGYMKADNIMGIIGNGGGIVKILKVIIVILNIIIQFLGR